MPTTKLLVILTAFVFCSPAFAEEKAASAPSSAPAATIDVSDKAAIQEAMNKQATVEGTVSEAAWSRSGKVMIIRFKDSEDFTSVLFDRNKDAMNKAFDGDITKALAGARIQVKGKIASYRDKPQIVVDKPEQITILK